MVVGRDNPISPCVALIAPSVVAQQTLLMHSANLHVGPPGSSEAVAFTNRESGLELLISQETP